jgi:hypothetical protein
LPAKEKILKNGNEVTKYFKKKYLRIHINVWKSSFWNEKFNLKVW